MDLIHVTPIRHLLSDGLTEHPHLPPEMMEKVHLRQTRLPKDCFLISFLNAAEPFQLTLSPQELSLSHIAWHQKHQQGWLAVGKVISN